ncbi:hypothetical protein FH966_15420 [Lentibacillus cibarius]|uniref:DUF4367 domain-containing protein n=1 Tax=Lentibacillus cibarius TaxID=2583219 RepID=A0A549YM83_9BACI|nr:hypothetical protein [Lentibacillus cibarius]TRM12986.1 hypothetical protein FH966_15420 [Lentibacillus cibarius]
MRRLLYAVTVLCSMVILTGCGIGKSEKEAVQNAGDTAKELFQEDHTMDTNHELDTFAIYVPRGLDVSKEEESNVILKDGNQTYIVFYNELEGPKSKLSYHTAAAKKDEALLLKAFKDKNKFGYIRIMPPNENDRYELQIGVGGVKITTNTPKRKLDSDADAMMKMARSIALENSETTQK